MAETTQQTPGRVRSIPRSMVNTMLHRSLFYSGPPGSAGDRGAGREPQRVHVLEFHAAARR